MTDSSEEAWEGCRERGLVYKECECCLEDQEISILAHIRRDTERWSLTVRPFLLSFSLGKLITDTHNVSDAQDAHFIE